MANYEQLLSNDREWALSEGSLFFEGRGSVQEALRRVTQRLDELNIPYAVAGGMALFAHGYRRFTEDVDILVTPPSLQRIHDELEGRGDIPPFRGSKQLRDTERKVKIEFLVRGQFPGDGRPKPVAFPDPAIASECIEGIRYVTLPTLVQLKLASGISGAGRLKDLADVQELVKALRLPVEFGDQLDPYVRPKFLELWEGAQHSVDEVE